MAEKCDYIVSNTIEINEAFRRVIGHDLHKRHGRYTYLYSTTNTIGMLFTIGVITETVAVMVTDNIDTEVYLNG